MRLDITSILSSLLLEQDENIIQLASRLNEGKKASDPLAIRFKPATREYITVMSSRLGISAAELVNILIESIMRETLTPRQAQAGLIPERFWLLMDTHDLTITDVVQLLSPWKIGLSVLESRERTMDYLTVPLLEQLARWFCISSEWLKGISDEPSGTPAFTSWRDATRQISEYLTPDDEPGKKIISLVINRTDVPAERTVGVFFSEHKLINGLTIKVTEYRGALPVSGEYEAEYNSFTTLCSFIGKKREPFISTFTVSPQMLSLLMRGQVLAISVLKKIIHFHINPSEQYISEIAHKIMLNNRG